jgi:hypothetical protein
MPTYRPQYVGINHSEALADAYINSPVDDPVFDTVELHHPDWSTPIRVVNDWEALNATLENDAPTDAGTEVVFSGIPFTFVRPAEGDSGVPAVVAIVVDNISTPVAEMIMQVQESEEPILAIIRTYLPSDTSAPHELPVRKMWVQSPVNITASRAQLQCSFGDLTNRRFPRVLYQRVRAAPI